MGGDGRLWLVRVHDAVEVHDPVAHKTSPSHTTQRLDVAQVVMQPDQHHEAAAAIAPTGTDFPGTRSKGVHDAIPLLAGLTE